MAEYAKPFSGKDQREFARRRSVINQIRAAKIRERRAARKAGDHGKDAAILMQGEKMGIPFGGVASAENLDQLVLSEMHMNKQIADKRDAQRANMLSRQAPQQPDPVPGKGPSGPAEQETNINVVSPGDTFFGFLGRQDPLKTALYMEDLIE
tara:strand:- start:135 stop:590 length:456 start_codon:yes stop_codon:yes gene_type:complete